MGPGSAKTQPKMGEAMHAFKSWHPAVLFCYFLCELLLCAFSDNPFFAAIAFVGAAFWFLLKNQFSVKSFLFYSCLFLVITVSNPIFSHNGVTPLFYLNGNAVTLEAIFCGAGFALTLVASLLWFGIFSKVMESDKLLYLFGKIAPKAALLFSTVLRYVPFLKRKAQQLHQTQKAMGLFSEQSTVGRLKSALRCFTALTSLSLESAIETGRSMKSRGFGARGRTVFHRYRFSFYDGFTLIFCLLCFSLAILALGKGKVGFYYYPAVTYTAVSWQAVGAYVAFAVLSLLPFFTELKEQIQWHFYRLKI